MICNNCECEHNGNYGSGRFCSAKCARGFSTKVKRKEINTKVSNKIKEKLELGERIGFSKISDKLISRINGRRIIGIKTCLNEKCKKEFNITSSSKHKKYCSHKCSSKFSKFHTNNVNWSEINKRSYSLGKNYVAGGTAKWIEIKTSSGIIKVQGSYEVRAVEILEKLKADGLIKNWQYGKIRIPYINIDGKLSTYIVDFLVEGLAGKYLLEIKGRESENDKCKWEAAQKIMPLVIWRKENLFV